MMTDYAIDRSRWSKMTIFEQMGNIYSEVGRSLKARSANNTQESQAALVRALDLFDATVDVLVSQKSVRSKEVLRAKDQYLELFYGNHPKEADVKKLEAYFLAFAIAARLNK